MAKKVRTLPRIAGVAHRKSKGNASSSAIIAVYSVKGGVGKTTLAANLAWCSAKAAERTTLLWDLDAAGGAGFLYGIEPKGSKLAEDVFSKNRDADKLIRKTDIEGLSILPADESIRGLDDQLARIGKRKRLANLASQLSKRYERILLDCPPVMNEVSGQVVRAADIIIVPLPPSPLSTRAFEMVAKEIASQCRQHPPILPVLSMLDLRRKLHREARDEHPDWPVIPYASVIEQCAVQQRPVGAIAPSSPAARSFTSLWNAIEKKLASRNK